MFLHVLLHLNSLNINMFLSIRRNVWRRLFTGTRTVFTLQRDVLEGRKDHSIQLGTNVDLFETNFQLKKLTKTGHLDEARCLFDKMSHRDEISWTTIISGYVSAFNASEALVLFLKMWVDPTIRIDPFILALALKACGCNAELKCGRVIHGYSVKTGFVNSVFVGSALLDMYTKSGSVSMGCKVFDEMPERNVVSWTAIITGLGRAGYHKESLMYFLEMWRSDVRCDSHTYASALKACADSRSLNYGKAIHTKTIKECLDSTSYVANTLATMYSKCGELDYGLCLFERMEIRDVVSWTTIIATFVQMGQDHNAIRAFVRMRESGVSPNEFTFAAVISGCASLAKIKWGEQLHAHVLHMGLVGSVSVSNAIMTMYSKCGQLLSSSMVFHEMSKRDVISWSTIIAGYSQDGCCDEAFHIFSWMRREGTKPNEFTLSSLLSVSGNMASLEQGKQVHAHVICIGLECDVMINSSLINMYSKCGSIEEASKIFDASQVEIVSWTAMINGYAEHGHSKKAIDLFNKMSSMGLRPDDVTLIGVLSACNHAGLVDLGFRYFNLMSTEYGIDPGKEHFGCMIDLLCRAGRLSDAEKMIHSMPFRQDDVVWSTLLRACRVHGDVDRARRAADRILELDPNCAGTHITLSNIYSATGKWRDAADMRKLMRSKGVMKEPGWSSIKVKDRVSAFVAGDHSHPQGDDIYSVLKLLATRTELFDDGLIIASAV